MRAAHLISDELFDQALAELLQGNHFITYNTGQYLLDKGDMYFFKEESDAREFVTDNISDVDHFRVIKASSIMDIYDHFMALQSLRQHPTILSQLKHITMEENNYEYLAKQLKFTGFGEGLHDELKRNMQEGKPEFTILHDTNYGKDAALAKLEFKKSAEKDMYFFNSYSMTLNVFGQGNPVEQKFYINNKQDNITLKEAYNMLSGRAVEKEITPKEGEKYRAWLQLDFKETDTNGQYKTKQFHPNYGFDLEKVLDRHPIRELETPEGKKQLMESLQRGNRQMVSLEAEGKDIKLFIEAAPQFKSLNYYDSSNKRVQSHELASSVKQPDGTEQKKETVKQKADGSDDDVDGPKKKRRRQVIR
jgi:hypothetical protein